MFDACAAITPELVAPAVEGDDPRRSVACLRHDPATVAAAGFEPQPVPVELSGPLSPALPPAPSPQGC